MVEQSRVGEVLAGKYRLEKLLGSGGVGVVYRAQNILIGRTVAIKLLRPEHASNENVVGRFMREARAANLVRHSHVVDVLDVDRDEAGIPFIVQEFLEGEDLGKYIKRGPGKFTNNELLDLLIPVAEAVGLAHARGVIHRDLKPENVFLSKIEGKVVAKLLDFGISYVRPMPGDVRMTVTGTTLGTPAFMSPEQIEGTRNVDARTDVWALGVILYEVFSGRLPFQGDTHASLFVQIVWVDPKPLHEAAPHVPRDLGRVVGRCLRRNPDDRYPTAAELARDLAHVRQCRQIEPTFKRSVPPMAFMPTQADIARALAPPPSSRGRRPASGAIVPSIGSQERQSAMGAVVELAHEPARAAKAGASKEAASAGEGSGISLATLRPPPPSTVADVQTDSAIEETLDPNRLVAMTVLGGSSVAAAALLMAVAHRAEGWPLASWARPLFDGSSPLTAAAICVVSMLLSVSIGSQALRPPRNWGAALISAGLMAIAAPFAMELLGADNVAAAAGRTTSARIVPLGAALVALGFGVLGVQHAWEVITGDMSWRRWTAGAVVALATAALFAAWQIALGTGG